MQEIPTGFTPATPHRRQHPRAALPYDHIMKLLLQREAASSLRIHGSCRRTSIGMTEHYPLLIDFELHRTFYRVRSNSIGRDLSGIIGTIDTISVLPSVWRLQNLPDDRISTWGVLE